MFGYQISSFISSIRAIRRPVDLGKKRRKAYVAIMQVVISLMVFTFGFIVLLSTKDEKLWSLAGGLMGTVVGYWLR